ncbi:hypothetical protein SAMN05519104_8345 [Rhizobiales bacterium GAS188]|nr:hypothetical protein SAMN05519104_8345 [Rhizobiales bacterium GAS188]
MTHLIKELKEFAPIGAVLVFAIGLIQYLRSESWKKTEFVAKLYKDFSADPDCQRALWLLQGDKRMISYKDGEHFQQYQFDKSVLVKALTGLTKKKHEPTNDELHIRDTLDRFLVYIEQFERAIQRHLVSQRDVYPYFGYWIALLKGELSLKPHSPVLRSILKYIDDAGFDDVQSFLARDWERTRLERLRDWLLTRLTSFYAKLGKVARAKVMAIRNWQR